MSDLFGDLIFKYTRAQAIADGGLIDVSETAGEAGFTFPVAVTARVWGQYVEFNAADACQSEQGRLWDILQVLRFTILRTEVQTTVILFTLAVLNRGKTEEVELKATCSPGDDGKPVITIMDIDED